MQILSCKQGVLIVLKIGPEDIIIRQFWLLLINKVQDEYWILASFLGKEVQR